jgi:hypothetical protein
VRRLVGDRVDKEPDTALYLVARTYKKWRLKMDDICLCREGAETFLHMQVACKLKSRRSAIQGAHDDVMRVLEEEAMREAPRDRRGVWNTRVRDLCPQVLSVAEREILVRKWKGQLGGPRMDSDFDSGQRVMRNKWTRMTELRSQTRGGERRGQSPRTAEATTHAVERKRKEAEVRRTATGKRKHGETTTPKWARRDMEIEVGNQKPDGVIFDTEEKMIYIIEGARCSDTGKTMETAEVTKIHKYRAMRENLRRRYPGYQVRQLNFIIGIQDKIIRRCMATSIEEMQRVLSAAETGGVG